ncbi:MAG: hypothetical protein ABJ205_06360 [Erythrobacter sp.]|uniref:hypothetical protein n=1 Tax=Erythrobacter sp. TaxID=1042 RepID=UPI00326761D1
MDRKSAILITFAAAAFGLSACAAQHSQLSLRETAWLAADGQLEALSSEPHVDREALFVAAMDSELADHYASPESLRNDLLVGEFLFEAPLLLGGQAAKAGISCHSCHVNGTDNPHFLFPAISGEAGTADTTHSFFSKSLGNQTFDPIVIPDLTMADKVDHSMKSGELEAFLTTIIIGEFSGAAAPSSTLAPIATYVRALRLSGPRQEPIRNPRSLTQDFADLRLAVDQAMHRARNAESELAALLLSSGQSQIRSIHERVNRTSHTHLRNWLIERSREMGALRQRLNARDPDAQNQLAALQERLRSMPDITDAEADSLYNPEVLAKALRQ